MLFATFHLEFLDLIVRWTSIDARDGNRTTMPKCGARESRATMLCFAGTGHAPAREHAWP
jgi:hypothetical protein